VLRDKKILNFIELFSIVVEEIEEPDVLGGVWR
jgi:hypothetical protein